MISALSQRLVDWLIKNGAESDDREVFIYGANAILNEVIMDIMLMVFAFAIGKPLEMLLWIISFMALRAHIGGCHVKSAILCFLLSLAISIGFVLVINYAVVFPFLLAIECVLALIYTFTVAPVLPPKRTLPPSRIRLAKQWGRITVIVEVAAISILHICGLQEASHAVALGMFAAAIFSLVGFFTN